MAVKRTQDTPWMVVDLMTNAVVGYYETEIKALQAHISEPVSVQYRPLKKRAKKKEFPYNGN